MKTPVSKMQIDKALKTKTELFSPHSTLLLIAIARKGNTNSSIEIALGNTGKWIEIPAELISEIKAVASIELNGIKHQVFEIEILRPEQNNSWYDLLLHLLNSLDDYFKMFCSKNCNCNDENNQELRVQARKVGKRTKTTIANCFVCWAITNSPGFCYYYGHCDN